jgi:hypothetical protein
VTSDFIQKTFFSDFPLTVKVRKSVLKQIRISYNFLTKEPVPTVIIWGKFVVKGLSSVFSAEPNFGSHKLKKNYDDSDASDDDLLDSNM